MHKPGYTVTSTSNHIALKNPNSNSIAVINRVSGSISIEAKPTTPSSNTIECFGFLGISHFSASKYIITISQIETVGRIKDFFVYLIKDIDFIPYNQSVSTMPEHKEDLAFMKMIKDVIHTDSFYYSYDYDITHRLQTISSFSDSEKSMPTWARAERRFFWNISMCSDFIQAGTSDLIIPVINGFVMMETVKIKGKSLDYSLISRRDHRRTGTRFNTRGLDPSGSAVNFVETEQVIGL